jgi:para-nitrobenzyl esterase
MTLRWSLLLPVLASLSAAAAYAADPIATIRAGRLSGITDGGIDRFLGIPYAAPPIGALRWRAPETPAPWQGVRRADRVGADCIQDKASNPPAPGYANPQSEDCLYLNIWRPAVHGTKRLPVMLWLHGGGFIMGSGAFPKYDGSALAANGVLVVTINYRLGRFGVFAHPALAREQAGKTQGNYGLMDQIAALRWVRENIAAFGGDPSNVTLFGQSAGASSVNFLMASPVARGLFAKAISESGSAYARLKHLSGGPDSLEEEGARWADKKGVARSDLAALRALPAETILDAPVLEPATPVIDGVILTETLTEAFARGHTAKVPYIVGANDYEDSLLRWLPGADTAMMARLGAEAEPILSLYTRPGEERARTLSRLWGEDMMVEPSRRRAKRLSETGTPVWLYRFSYVPEALRTRNPGAGHDAEIEMVFDTPSATSRPGWTATDEAMAKAVSGYWIAFAKTGDPNHAGALAWPRFATGTDRLMEFARTGPVVIEDFGRVRLDRIEAAEIRAEK